MQGFPECGSVVMLGGDLCAKPRLCSVADASKGRSTLDGRVVLGGMITLDGGVILGGIITLNGRVVLGGTIMFNRKCVGVRDKGGLIVIG